MMMEIYMKYRNLCIFALVFFLCDCTAKPTEMPASEVLPGVTITTPEVVNIPLVSNSEASQPVQEEGILLTEGNLTVTIFAPSDSLVVLTSPIEVRGTTNTETVMTINGLLVLLDADQEFAFQVDLEEGYNTIEVVASDYEGNQVELILTVIYEM